MPPTGRTEARGAAVNLNVTAAAAAAAAAPGAIRPISESEGRLVVMVNRALAVPNLSPSLRGPPAPAGPRSPRRRGRHRLQGCGSGQAAPGGIQVRPLRGSVAPSRNLKLCGSSLPPLRPVLNRHGVTVTLLSRAPAPGPAGLADFLAAAAAAAVQVYNDHDHHDASHCVPSR
jgi:hypothetical protein